MIDDHWTSLHKYTSNKMMQNIEKSSNSKLPVLEVAIIRIAAPTLSPISSHYRERTRANHYLENPQPQSCFSHGIPTLWSPCCRRHSRRFPALLFSHGGRRCPLSLNRHSRAHPREVMVVPYQRRPGRREALCGLIGDGYYGVVVLRRPRRRGVGRGFRRVSRVRTRWRVELGRRIQVRRWLKAPRWWLVRGGSVMLLWRRLLPPCRMLLLLADVRVVVLNLKPTSILHLRWIHKEVPIVIL